ncbi:MAG: hypothetical protein QXE05_12875 [Nitrososphaeria archaeon]
MQPKIQEIELEKKLSEIEARREELFEYYRGKSDCFITYVDVKKDQREVEQRNLEDLKRSWDYKLTKNLLPKRLVKFQHNGPLKILAFSDYRVHNIDALLNFVKGLKEKPDLIVYAGDDVDRFAPLPEGLFQFIFNHNDELKEALVSDDERMWISPLYYGFILRLPKIGADEDAARSRIHEVIEFINALYDRWNENKTLSEKDLEVLLSEYQKFQLRRKKSDLWGDEIDIVDSIIGTTIISLKRPIKSLKNLGKNTSKDLVPDFCSSYFRLYKLIRNRELSTITIKKVREDNDYAYFHISLDGSKRNVFEELASYARYGLVAVIGNDAGSVDRFRIHGRNVYEVHNTWIKLGHFLIVGFEGSTCGMGPSGKYLEGDVRLRLELAQKMLGSRDRLVIVSHSPPKGVLDRAMRFGDKAIGSLALRDFLEESNSVTLVVCGHVHRCGGKYEKINSATIVNVSSHDDSFSRANIAWVILEQNGEIKEIKWSKLPSLLETIFIEYDGEERLLHLQKEVGLSKVEAKLFMEAYKKYGSRLLDDLQELANIKYQYGFSWNNIFRLYDRGVKTPESITKAVYEEMLKESNGIHKVNLKKAYTKVLREREKGNIYLIYDIPIPDNNQIVIFDTEYSATTGVLYGFLDMESGEFKQFWFDEKPKAQEFLRTKLTKFFIYWGGSDRWLLQQELGCQASTINLLYFVQISLIAPISSANLHDVHDILYGRIEDEFWKRSFYEKNGLDKLALCKRILREPNNAKAREELAAANKADILALQHIIEKIRQLKSSIRPHSCKVEKF